MRRRAAHASYSQIMVNSPTDVRPVYTIDVDDRLALVNPAALSLFAPAHHPARGPARSLSAQSLLGRSVWDFIAQAQIRQLWQVLYSRVRAAGAPVFVPMRADTHSCR